MSLLSEVIMDWKGWLKEGSFYIHGFIYMTVRIAVNVTMVNSLVLININSLFNPSTYSM